MGYRPVTQKPDRRESKRLKQLDKLCKERNAYMTLLREYNSDGNTPVVEVTLGLIRDVDKRIEALKPPASPLPPVNPSVIQGGHIA